MSLTTVVFYALLILPPLLLAGVGGIMLRRGLRTQYPYFFAYIVYQVAIFPLLFFFFHRSPDQYFYVYWATAALSPIFGLAVIAELFRHAFRPFEALQGISSTMLRWAAVLGALCLLIFALNLTGSGTHRLAEVVMVLHRSVRVLQVSLVLLILLFASRLGLTFRHHLVGIAAGFGIFAAVDLMLASVVLRVEPAWYSVLNTFKTSVYLGTTVLWMAVLYRPEPARVPELEPAPVSTEAFSFALPESSLPPPPDSLLLSMEKMVERRLNGHGNGGNGSNGHGKANGNGHRHGSDRVN
jgi:hypothetical protein